MKEILVALRTLDDEDDNGPPPLHGGAAPRTPMLEEPAAAVGFQVEAPSRPRGSVFLKLTLAKDRAIDFMLNRLSEEEEIQGLRSGAMSTHDVGRQSHPLFGSRPPLPR